MLVLQRLPLQGVLLIFGAGLAIVCICHHLLSLSLSPFSLQVCKLPGDLINGEWKPGRVEDCRYGIQGPHPTCPAPPRNFNQTLQPNLARADIRLNRAT